MGTLGPLYTLTLTHKNGKTNMAIFRLTHIKRGSISVALIQKHHGIFSYHNQGYARLKHTLNHGNLDVAHTHMPWHFSLHRKTSWHLFAKEPYLPSMVAPAISPILGVLPILQV